MRLNTNMSWLLGCWMLSFTFSGCQEDGVEVYPDAPAEDGYFTLTMQNERMLPTQVKTRASDPKEDEEKEIRQLYLFFFRQSGQYLETYQNRFIGFQKPAEGQATVKVDRNAINQLTGGESVIIYAWQMWSRSYFRTMTVTICRTILKERETRHLCSNCRNMFIVLPLCQLVCRLTGCR